MPPEPVLQVFLFRNGEFLGTDVFTNKRVLIGRDIDSADLVLGSTHVSRRHAVLEHDNGHIFIQDAASKNGIYVNDQKIERRTEVTRLDKVTIGDFSMKFKIVTSGDSDAPAARSPSAPPSMGSTIEGVVDSQLPLNATDFLKTQVSPSRSTTPVSLDDDTAPPEAEPSEPVVLPSQELTPVFVGRLDQTDDGATIAVRQNPLKKPNRAVYGDYHGTDEDNNEGDVGAKPVAAEATLTEGDPATVINAPERPRTAATASASIDDDDHDEDEDFVPPYSLVKQLLKDGGAERGGQSKRPRSIEVLTVTGDRLVDLAVIGRGQRPWRHGTGVRGRQVVDRALHTVALDADGHCTVRCRESVQGSVRRGKETIPIASIATTAGSSEVAAKMQEGDMLMVQDGASKHYLRYVTAPEPAQDKRTFWQKLGVDARVWSIVVASLSAHAVLAVLVTVLVPSQPPRGDVPDEFVVTVRRDPDLQEPPKPPEPTPQPPAPPEPAPPQKVSARHPVPRRAAPSTTKRPAARTPATASAPNPAPPGVLGLLAKQGNSTAPGAAAAAQAVSNLNAVKVPGNGGSFRVSGLIGKLPASSGIAIGGGSGLVTKGGNALLRGGAGGAGHLADSGDRAVQGLVQKAPRAMHTGGQGTLDRALIEKVINEHIDEVQRCYERELLRDASLSGKVQVEWTIGMDGNVTSVRQVFTSVKSVAAVRCIMNAVKTWRFPHPQGGPVLVNNPFIFKSIGF